MTDQPSTGEPVVTQADREAKLQRMMLAMAKTHDRIVSEREQGAAAALRAGNGMATHYWREIAKTARRHREQADTLGRGVIERRDDGSFHVENIAFVGDIEMADIVAAFNMLSGDADTLARQEGEDMWAFIRECVEAARSDYVGYHESNKPSEPDTSKYDAALSFLTTPTQAQQTGDGGLRDVLDRIADGVTWNSSPLQCLDRISQIVREERAALQSSEVTKS